MQVGQTTELFGGSGVWKIGAVEGEVVVLGGFGNQSECYLGCKRCFIIIQ